MVYLLYFEEYNRYNLISHYVLLTGYFEGIFLDCVKIAITVLVCENGDKDEHSYYRSTSLVPFFSKSIGQAMEIQLSSYFEENKQNNLDEIHNFQLLKQLSLFLLK